MSAAPDLRTRYLGLDLRSPIVASASPLNDQPDRVQSIQDAGPPPLVLPSLFAAGTPLWATEPPPSPAAGCGAGPRPSGVSPPIPDWPGNCAVFNAGMNWPMKPIEGSSESERPGCSNWLMMYIL